MAPRLPHHPLATTQGIRPLPRMRRSLMLSRSGASVVMLRMLKEPNSSLPNERKPSRRHSRTSTTSMRTTTPRRRRVLRKRGRRPRNFWIVARILFRVARAGIGLLNWWMSAARVLREALLALEKSGSERFCWACERTRRLPVPRAIKLKPGCLMDLKVPPRVERLRGYVP